MSAFVAAAVACATLMVAMPAIGADPMQVAGAEPAGAQVQISTRGLDLDDRATREALERRIDRAAAQACGVDPTATLEARRQQNLCMIAAGNSARARLKQIQASREVRMAGL